MCSVVIFIYIFTAVTQNIDLHMHNDTHTHIYTLVHTYIYTFLGGVILSISFCIRDRHNQDKCISNTDKCHLKINCCGEQ